jgi:hypothetical protein
MIKEDLKSYNLLGLREICSVNRDILSSFRYCPRKDLEQRMLNVYDSIVIPLCISNNPNFFLKRKKLK